MNVSICQRITHLHCKNILLIKNIYIQYIDCCQMIVGGKMFEAYSINVEISLNAIYFYGACIL